MAIITTGSFSKALWPGVNTFYGKAYDEYPVQWDKLFDKFTSRTAFEAVVGITPYTHINYALGFIITQEMFDDDLYDVAAEKRARGLAFSMRQTKETVAAN